MKNLAQIKEYTVLAPLPGTTIEGKPDKADLASYVPGLFSLMIGLSAVLAVAWIVWGGIEYITTDSWSGKEEGKNRIWNAVIGLVIVACAWLILYTINPNLLKLKLDIESSTVTALGSGLSPISGGRGTPTASCTDCVSIPGYIATKNGGYISASVLPNVVGLNEALDVEWIITEANPPSSGHASSCHKNGTCFDSNFLDRDQATNRANIEAFLNAAKNNGFPGTIYEVATEAARKNIIDSGKISEANKSKIKVNDDPNFTAPHFHVTK